jgi:G3E family GTPase
MASEPHRGPADRKSRQAPPPIPLTLVTGLSGVGKTTLLNRLLRNANPDDILVLLETPGAIKLEHPLAEILDGFSDARLTECACCSLRGDLIGWIENQLRKRDNGRIALFKRLIVETPDPAPFVHGVLTHPYLAMRFRVDGVIVVVDAATETTGLDIRQDTAKLAAIADLVAITKIDLLQRNEERNDRLKALTASLRAINPVVRIYGGVGDEISPSILTESSGDDLNLYLGELRETLKSKIPSSRQKQVSDFPLKDDSLARGHCIIPTVLRSRIALHPQALQGFLDSLGRSCGPRLLRVKGLIKLSDDPNRPLVINGVHNRYHPPVRLPDWTGDDRNTQILFIVCDMDPNSINRIWSTFAGLAYPHGDKTSAGPMPNSGGGLFS